MVRGPFHYENSLCNFWYKISDRCRGYWSTGPKTINLVRQTWGQCHYMRLTVGRSLNCDIFWHNVHKMTRPGTGHPYITYNLLHFVAFFHVASLFLYTVDNRKVGGDNKKLSFNQNVWRDHATMQQDVLLHFWVIFLY